MGQPAAAAQQAGVAPQVVYGTRAIEQAKAAAATEAGIGKPLVTPINHAVGRRLSAAYPAVKTLAELAAAPADNIIASKDGQSLRIDPQTSDVHQERLDRR